MNELKKVDISTLSQEDQNEITAIKDNMVLSYDYISNFGTDLDQKYNTVSTALLDEIRLKDSPEASEVLSKLLSQLEPIDTENLLEKKKSFFRRIFKVDEVKNLADKYKSVQDVINEAKKGLQETSFSLKKDIEVCDANFKNTCEYISALDKRIMAGRLFCEEEEKKIAEDLLATNQDDTYAMTILDQRQRELNRMKRKVDSFVLKKEAKVINGKELLIMKENCASLIEQIDTAITDAVPLWEANLLIAIQLVRQQNALKIKDSAKETTNELFKANMEMLKVNSIGIAKGLESGFVDYNVLKDVQNKLTETVTEIKKVHADSEKQREKIMAEIEAKNKEMGMVEFGIAMKKEMA